eukprot:6465824-Amphidinium_carterae.1
MESERKVEEPTPEEAEASLLEYLVQLHQTKGLAATQLGTIAFWAERCGLKSFGAYATRPGVSTGNYQKKVDKAMGFADAKAKLYPYPVASYCRAEGKRKQQTLYGMELVDIIEKDLANAGLLAATDIRRKILEENISDEYWQHPVLQVEGPPVVPVALFIDGLVYGRQQNMLVFVVVNLVTKKRHLLTAVRKTWGCACGCGSWCTLACIYQFIHYTFKCMEQGYFPTCRHDGSDFGTDIFRQERSGTPMR